MKPRFHDLKINKKSIRLSDFQSLIALFVPAIGFALVLMNSFITEERFYFLLYPSQYPIELIIMILFGTIATVGGISDWLFHRLYVTSGPNERKAHLLALATGGIPLFILMTCASLSNSPNNYLIPILVVVLYTTSLICYDEFIFHTKRCCYAETIFHRMLVFGNCIAWLAWMNWCFVRGF